MTLREARCQFTKLIGHLLVWWEEENDTYNSIALDEGMQRQEKGHMKGSLHYFGCAQDILLYDEKGTYLTGESEATGVGEYRKLGEHWKSLHSLCRWGGDWGDGGHVSFSPPELFGKRA